MAEQYSKAFFLPSAVGERFCIHHAPSQGPTRQALVYVHPFAEEMNKSRRMVALQSRALAAQGVAVLQIDLLGCGDSSGEFGDASWDAWIDDVHHALRWLRAHHDAPLGLWGLRAGCLLAAEVARQTGQAEQPLDFVFWQPVNSGKAHLAQFLRLLSAAAWGGGATGPSVKEARAMLENGQSVEVAGYELTPGLARGLEHSTLAAPTQAGRGFWFEVSVDEADTLSPATLPALNAWRAVHRELMATCVTGPAFWQTQEIEEAPALLDATSRALSLRPMALQHA